MINILPKKGFWQKFNNFGISDKYCSVGCVRQSFIRNIFKTQINPFNISKLQFADCRLQIRIRTSDNCYSYFFATSKCNHINRNFNIHALLFKNQGFVTLGTVFQMTPDPTGDYYFKSLFF